MGPPRLYAGIMYADPDALRQIVTNLADNSLRYTSAGGTVTVETRIEGRGVLLTVRDTGAGIAQEHLPRLFERFYRADASRSRDEGGTGLGLAIVRDLVELYGGKITLGQSELGGLKARLALPEFVERPS